MPRNPSEQAPGGLAASSPDRELRQFLTLKEQGWSDEEIADFLGLTDDRLRGLQGTPMPSRDLPPLERGKNYQYTLTAAIVRDGQKLAATERVTVRAGQETRVSLPPARFATASVVQK